MNFQTKAELDAEWQKRGNCSARLVPDRLDQTSDSSDYSYWSESDLEEDDSNNSCELSSDNYTDSDDIFSPNQSSVCTCELSTHNYTPNTAFSTPNESLRGFSIYDDIPAHAHSTDSINADADYVNVPKVVNVYYTSDSRVVSSPLERSTVQGAEIPEMGNASNKVGPALEEEETAHDTVGSTCCRSRRNSRVYSSKRRSKRNVSLLTFSMTPVCVGTSESTTFLADATEAPVPSSLTKEVVSMAPDFFRYQEVSSPPSSVQSGSDESVPKSPDRFSSHDMSSSTNSSCSDIQEQTPESSQLHSRIPENGVMPVDDDDDDNNPWRLRMEFDDDSSSDDDDYNEQSYRIAQPSTTPSIGSTLRSMHRSLELMSRSLDSYENDLKELSHLQDLSDTFSSLDSSLNSISSDHDESDLDSSFSSISSFDSSDDSFTYEPLKTSPTVHHQVQFNPSKSLEFISTEKLLPDTDSNGVPVVPESENEASSSGSSTSRLLDSDNFTTPFKESKPCEKKFTSFSCDSKKRNSSASGNESDVYPTASTPVSKLLTGAAKALSSYSPRDLMKEFQSASSLDSGCESQDSGYKSRKLSLSSNAQSSTSSSAEKVCRDHRKSSATGSAEALSSRSESYEELSAFLASSGNWSSSNNADDFPVYSYLNKVTSPRLPTLMLTPEDLEDTSPLPNLPEKPSSPLLPFVENSNDTSISSLTAVPSTNSSSHLLYNPVHCLDISPSKPKKSGVLSKKFKLFKNFVKRRRSSSEVKHIGSRSQLYAIPYEGATSRRNNMDRSCAQPTSARVLQLL